MIGNQLWIRVFRDCLGCICCIVVATCYSIIILVQLNNKTKAHQVHICCSICTKNIVPTNFFLTIFVPVFFFYCHLMLEPLFFFLLLSYLVDKKCSNGYANSYERDFFAFSTFANYNHFRNDSLCVECEMGTKLQNKMKIIRCKWRFERKPFGHWIKVKNSL